MTENPVERDNLPDRFATEKQYIALRPSLEERLQRVFRQLRAVFEEKGYSPTIKYRVKGFDNYYNKLVKLATEEPEKECQISDLLGIRLVCPFLEDLDIVERLISKHFKVVELERKAEQHSFREFGYDSVHLLIELEDNADESPLPNTANLCEIQLRTILQEAWAEVEHELVYKSNLGFPNESIKRKLASLNASLTLSDLIFQEIRDYQREVRVRGLKRRQSVEEMLETTPIATNIDHLADTVVTDSELDESSRGLEKLMYKALEAHSNKHFAQAVQLYRQILRMKLEPTVRSLVYNHRGMALFALAENQRAIEDFSRAVHFNSDNFRAWSNRGLVYRVLGKFDQSLEDYNRALNISPQLDGFWGRAQTCFEMKLFTRALGDCQKALDLQADFVPAQELQKTVRRQMF